MVFRTSPLVGPMWPVRGVVILMVTGKKSWTLVVLSHYLQGFIHLQVVQDFTPFEKHMSQRSKRFKTKKKCISASNSPTRWKGQGRDASEPKKWVFGFSKASVQGGNGTQLGKIFPDFSSFKWSLIGHLLKKNVWKANWYKSFSSSISV